MIPVLKPTKLKYYNKNIFGFDIETYGKNNNFYLGGIYHLKHGSKLFYDEHELIEYFKQNKFRNSTIACTNLGFDFFGTFIKNKDELQKFRLLSAGSKLLTASTYIDNGEFKRKGRYHKITFIDTLNYASLSVDQLGRILQIPKLEKPEFLGQIPKTDIQRQQLERYNLRDAEISCKGLHFLYKSFNDLGASAKITIASTAMSLFRNKYLDRYIFRGDEERLLEQFKGYYGGRTEAFMRGELKNFNYYDYNSLYPYVMYDNEYPDPNTVRITGNDKRFIYDYEGLSFVDVSTPFLDYPLLPVRHEGKLLFPYGEFRGWYSHAELRKAEELGYKILKVRKTYYTKQTCRPFREYVLDLYSKRLKYKETNNPMQFVTKILMNSLYGKFGQKFRDRDNFIPWPDTLDELHKFKDIKRVGDFLRVVQDSKPALFCIPLWASHITTHARLRLYDGICKSKPAYCDTDSLITKKEMPTSKDLGMLKLEKPVKKAIVVKPKMYAIFNDDWDIKVKGLGRKVTIDDFKEILQEKPFYYQKFTKIRESQRRNIPVNAIQEIEKLLSLEDNKRKWDNPFSPNELQISEPIKLSII